MDWVSYFATAAVGSFLGVVVKELLDLLKSRQSHARELQKRYFDAKLQHTLESVTLLKGITIMIRDVMRDLDREASRLDEASDPLATLQETFHALGGLSRIDERLEQLQHGEAGVRASLTFFYGDRWNATWPFVESALETTTDAVQQLGQIIKEFNTLRNEAGPDGARMKAAVFRERILSQTRDLAASSAALDQAMDDAMNIIRSDYSVL